MEIKNVSLSLHHALPISSESVSPSVKATLSIATTGSVGTTGLDVALTVSATDLLRGQADRRTNYTAMTSAAVPCAVRNGSQIDSRTATMPAWKAVRREGG